MNKSTKLVISNIVITFIISSMFLIVTIVAVPRSINSFREMDVDLPLVTKMVVSVADMVMKSGILIPFLALSFIGVTTVFVFIASRDEKNYKLIRLFFVSLLMLSGLVLGVFAFGLYLPVFAL